MREIFEDIRRWLAEGENGVAVATVLHTFGSAPRGVGAKMAVSESGRVSGSVSGGCVEAAVIDASRDVIARKRHTILHFETADDNAWNVGLPCGGNIDVLVEALSLEVERFLEPILARNAWAALATVIDGPPRLVGVTCAFAADGTHTDAYDRELAEEVFACARERREAETRDVHGMTVFIDPILPAPTVVIVGGVHIGIALVGLARAMGFRVSVIDPRKTFGNEERFGGNGCVVAEWPDDAFRHIEITEDTAVVVLTHDPKLDDPALDAALRSPAFYIGALGSVRSQEQRRERLRGRGFADVDIDRIHGPVGIEIGARTPEEIALSILSEIVAERHGVANLPRAKSLAVRK